MMPPLTFELAGQCGFVLDTGHPAGYFHVYENFSTSGYRYPERKLVIFVPRDYEVFEESYPVIYWNDGDTVFFPGGLVGKSLDLADVLQERYQGGTVRKELIVAIYPVNRNVEYTHAAWFGKDCCGLHEYMNCILGNIKPFVDSAYRTRTDTDNTRIIGESHGGLAAFYIAGCKPDVFGFAACLSPSLWVGVDDSSRFPMIATLPNTLGDSNLIKLLDGGLKTCREMPVFYLDWGLVRSGGPHNAHIEERSAARGREMAQLLQERYGYKLEENLFLSEDPVGEHDEDSWKRRLRLILQIPDGMKVRRSPANPGARTSIA